METIIEIIGNRWQPIPPFGRASAKTIQEHLKDGESEYEVCSDFVHVVENNGKPPKFVELTRAEIEELKTDFNSFRANRDLYRSKCFLWVIDNQLKIAREEITNVKRSSDPKYICHTNLTSAGEAYVAGEVLFGEDGFVYVNYFSDRYGGRGTPEDLWKAAKNVFVALGYTNLTDFLDLSES
jgi:hypothetical protein